MRNPFGRRRDPSTFSATQPHPFQAARRGGLAAFLAGNTGSRGAAGVTAVAGTSAYLRTEGCVVPGCGTSRGDSIHAPADP